MLTLATSEGHHLDLVLLGVLVAVALFLLAAQRSGLPYPILLVVGGGLFGFMPGSPDASLDPDLVLVIFLPPLLYSAAFFSSLSDLRANIRPISMLAIGLVVVTSLVVGVVAKLVIDELSWAAAFTLGAVLSPTDPVAATAIAGRSGAPRRFITVVEGESLVNDATALIAYRFGVAAVLTGSFSVVDALGTFAYSAAAGIAIGIGVGVVIAWLRARLDDPPTEITISLLTPYFAYLPAEALGVSAVLAAVVAGIWLGWRSPQLITPATRMQAFAFWEILVFLMNAALFVLVGLELPHVVEAAREGTDDGTLVLYGLLIATTIVVVRFLWVFPTTYLPRILSARIRDRTPVPDIGHTFLVAFTGMRGAVSLAAALAIPETTDAGVPFPGRDLIIFIVYVTILVTVVVQGLTLGPLIRALNVEDDEDAHRLRESKARLRAADAAISRIDELADEAWVRNETADRMRGLYEYRVKRFSAHFDDEDDGDIERRSQAYQRLRREVLNAERGEIIRLRNQGFINDEMMRRIERDLDLEDARLED
ncbi:putative Na(+)/H(+) exchanger [Paraconexibacter sp. AEG42_29]|uniref:Na(+)/H(+) exchanger n=1 Tax=Paraconexibacter sp. AEG42_29 TaxID=2997339 RepID=A0AAU7B011_9ACTN